MTLNKYNSNEKVHMKDISRQSVSVQEIQGPFNPKVFASTNCWGNQPLLIRSAFDPVQVQNDFGGWPSSDDISMLASDEEAESRMITHYPGDNSSYQLQLGPFLEEDIQNLLNGADEISDENISTPPPPKWTIVVNDVDRFCPPLADWIHSTFSFIPTWRRDDAQFSLSQSGGGIGPHVDNFDVFLIQTSGQREWKVGNRKISEKEEMDRNIPGLDVRILGETNTESSLLSREKLLSWDGFFLEPGDCLYLPPRVAHQGTALSDDCMTLSVGCRAPSASDMISKIAEDMSMAISGKAVERYQDLNLLDHFIPNASDDGSNIGSNFQGVGKDEMACAEITKEAKDKAKLVVKEAILELIDDDDAWDCWFGSFVSEPKRTRFGYPIALSSDDVDESELEDHQEWLESLGVWGDPKQAVATVLSGEGFLCQAEGVTFSYTKLTISDRQSFRLFVNGMTWDIKSELTPVDIIANERRISKKSFENREISADTIVLLEDLVDKGLLYGISE